MFNFRKSSEKSAEAEEDPEIAAKRKEMERQREYPPDEQTPTVSADHFEDEPKAILALRKILAADGKYGFPGTDGSRWANYKQHVLNTHPLISICYAHEEHPFDHWERGYYLFCMLSITFLLAAALKNGLKLEQENCDGENPECNETCAQMSCDSVNSQKLVMPIVVAMITIPLDIVLKGFMVCGWVQGWKMQETCESIGGFCMKIQLCYAVFFLIIAFILAAGTGDFAGTIMTFVYAQVESWALFFIKSFVLFNIFFNGGKASFRKKYPGLVSIETDGLKRACSTGTSLPGSTGANLVSKPGGAVVQQNPDAPVQPSQVQMQIQQPQQIMVVCPPGATPGQQIQFPSPQGGVLMAVIPQGVSPGQQFPVLMGPPPPVQQVVAAPVSQQKAAGGFAMPSFSGSKPKEMAAAASPVSGGLLDFSKLQKKK